MIKKSFSEWLKNQPKPKKCAHIWKKGYLGDVLVFCENCNKDADEVYPGMSWEEQLKLTQ